MAATQPGLLAAIRVLDAFTDWTGKAVAWAVVPLATGLTYEVISRYVFDAPTEWAFDVTDMLYGGHFAGGRLHAAARRARRRR